MKDTRKMAPLMLMLLMLMVSCGGTVEIEGSTSVETISTQRTEPAYTVPASHHGFQPCDGDAHYLVVEVISTNNVETLPHDRAGAPHPLFPGESVAGEDEMIDSAPWSTVVTPFVPSWFRSWSPKYALHVDAPPERVWQWLERRSTGLISSVSQVLMNISDPSRATLDPERDEMGAEWERRRDGSWVLQGLRLARPRADTRRISDRALLVSARVEAFHGLYTTYSQELRMTCLDLRELSRPLELGQGHSDFHPERRLSISKTPGCPAICVNEE